MTIRNAILILVPVLALVFTTAVEAAPTSAPVGDAYPLATCPVSGAKLGTMGAPVAYVHEGRQLSFCCKGCLPAFKKNPAAFLTKVDAAIVAEQAPLYPLKTCVVSGKSIGGEAKPVEHVYKNRLVRLSDQKCVEVFSKDPAKYLTKLDEAVVAAQKATYPLTTCVISGGKLGAMGAPVDYVHGNRLVRFCCEGCIGAFRKSPLTALAKIDAAAAPGVSSDDAPGKSCGDGCGDGCGKSKGREGGGCGGGGCGGGGGGCGGK